jgi:hypothetical protein
MEKCLTENEIMTYCDIVNVKGSSNSERCKNILKKISTKESCITKSQLINITDRVGISSKGTKKDIIKKLRDYKGESRSLTEGQKIRIINDSIKKNVVEEKTESCIVYSVNNNFITTVQVPDKAFNTNHEWIPIRRTCYSVGFYRSSGTSNTKVNANFPYMWFPVYRIKETDSRYSGDEHRGWIWKASTLQRKRSVEVYKNGMKIKDTDFLYLFFEKFEFWWQVQISAALPSVPESLWNTHPELIMLRSFCLLNSWDNGSQTFYLDPNIVTFYQVVNCNRKVDTPEEVNKWLLEKHALCINDKNEGISYPKRKGKKFK